MGSIVLLDTSIYLNVLDVPRFNQNRGQVGREFAGKIKNGDSFLLPMATIWETGNHIAGLATGGERRRFARKLVDDVTSAMNGDTPYRATYFPKKEQFIAWLKDFPESAARSKSAKKQREGVSLADHSMIKEWEHTCTLNNMSRVLIWSLDVDLAAYDSGNR